jgi:alpha-tubulin suppressor-like RCC1 family protein
MSSNNQFISGFQESASENNVDLGNKFVSKSYLMDVYPYLTGMGNIKMAGLWTWGDNGSGQLGNNTTTINGNPAQTISFGTNWKQGSCGDGHVATIKTDGTLWTWGINTYGQLGDSLTFSKSTPAQTTAGGTNWKQSACGTYHTAAIKTDGTLWLWGSNFYGEIGNNTINNYASPIQTTAFGSNWKQVTCGNSLTAAIKADGTLWTWGLNSSGQLGDNGIVKKSSPVQTTAFGSNWKQVSCGGQHIAAIKTDGTLWTWGYNLYGQLGNNTITNNSSPIQTIAYGTNWKQVACGNFHTVAIKTDGTLWTWGYNTHGELGDNSINHKSSPVQTTAFGSNWKQVAGGKEHTTAIKTNGTLWCWGRNAWGDIGDNTTTDRSSPVQTTAFGSNWKQTAAGNGFTVAITEMGDDF